MSTATDTTTSPAATESDDRWKRLPDYVRSLLKIDVTLGVLLAEKKMPLAQILELAPGSMVQFPHRYDEPVRLTIGDHTIAEGEVVKVGDRFGIRISTIVLPAERFARVQAKRDQENRIPPGGTPEDGASAGPN